MAKKKMDERTVEALQQMAEGLKTLCEKEGVDVAELMGIEADADSDDDSDEDDSDDDSEDGDDEEVNATDFIEGIEDIAEVKSIAKELGVKVGAKDKIEAIKKNILKKDEDELNEALSALGFLESEDEEGEEDGDEEDTDINAEEILKSAELDDVKAVAKALKIKVDAKAKAKDIIAKILEKDEEAVIEALTEAGLVGEEEEEVTEEDVKGFLDDMSTGNLKKLAKAMDIELSKKAKTAEQMATEIMDASDFETVYDALEENGFLGDEEE